MHSKHVIGRKKNHFLLHLCFTMNVLMVAVSPSLPPTLVVCLITLFPGGIVPNKQKQENVSNSWTSYEIKIEIVRKKIVTIF